MPRKKHKKVEVPARPGKPTKCIACGEKLHSKSEHYCSQKCADTFESGNKGDKPAFLSKWKLRKRRLLRDPFARARDKTRRKTKNLIKTGRLVKRSCAVCGNREVIAHHEDYNKAFKVIWMCEKHHKQYHDGEIALFRGKLKWDSERLTQIDGVG